MGVLFEELALLWLWGRKREDQPGGMRMVALGGGWRRRLVVEVDLLRPVEVVSDASFHSRRANYPSPLVSVAN